jgi:hypothetical protein
MITTPYPFSPDLFDSSHLVFITLSESHSQPPSIPPDCPPLNFQPLSAHMTEAKSRGRYHPNREELRILIQGVQRYFALPSRSPIRNRVARDCSLELQVFSPHWTHRTVRLWFNNNRHTYAVFSQQGRMTEPQGPEKALELNEGRSGFQTEDGPIENNRNGAIQGQCNDGTRVRPLVERVCEEVNAACSVSTG